MVPLIINALSVVLAASLGAGVGAGPRRAPDSGAQAIQEGDGLWRLKRTRSALEAFGRAAQSTEHASEAHQRMARIYFFKGWEAEGAFPGWHEEVAFRQKALSAFNEAARHGPLSDESLSMRWSALRSMGRDAGPEPPGPAPRADAVSADRIQKLLTEKQYGDVIVEAKAFLARFPSSDRLPLIGDALIKAYAATPDASTEVLAAAINSRIGVQPDPGAYLEGATLLITRGALDQGAKLAVEMVPATEVFISQNLDSYRLADKANGFLNRTRATSADLVGWVLFLKGDISGAETRLTEAERLSRGQDFTNQFHLGELWRKKGDPKQAGERYLNALSLRAGADPLRSAARQALAQLQADAGQDAAGFDSWLAADLDRRWEERRVRALRSMQDRPVPQLPLASLTGQPLDMSKLKGKVLLYKFFASW